MDYEKAYKEAFERAKQVHASNVDENKKSAEYIFPVLKESEDERIRKALIEYFNEQCDMSDWNGIYGYQVVAWLKKQDEKKQEWGEDEKVRKELLAVVNDLVLPEEQQTRFNTWLEKQGEQKPAWSEEELKEITTPKSGTEDKIEPRFKVGDWVVANYSGKIGQVVAVSEDGYGYQLDDGLCFGVSWCDIFHLWCIKDARDGDILASDCSVFIFQKEYIAGKPTAYCGIVDGNFCQGSGGCWTNEQCHPATKEQWDTLRSKMKEAGYEWDSEKKELKEIAAPKPEAGDDEEDDKEAVPKSENWKLTLARRRLGNEARTGKTLKVRKYDE